MGDLKIEGPLYIHIVHIVHIGNVHVPLPPRGSRGHIPPPPPWPLSKQGSEYEKKSLSRTLAF